MFETTRLSPTRQTPSLGVNFSWMMLGSAAYGACQWGIVILLAKVTSPEHLGRFTLAFAVTAPIIMFYSLQLRTLQATDATHRYGFSDYLGLRLLTNLLSLATLGCLLYVTDYSTDTKVVILLVGLAKTIEATSDILLGGVQKLERMDLIGKSLTFKSILTLLLFGISISLTRNLTIACLHLILAWALVLLFYDLPRSRATLSDVSLLETRPGRPEASKPLAPRWHGPALKELVALAWPLGISTLLLSLFANVPNYTIERYLGLHTLGLFGSMFYFVLLGQKVVAAATIAVLPRLSVLRTRGDVKSFRKLMIRIIFFISSVGLLLVTIALVAGRQILAFLYGPEYTQSPGLFAIILLAGTCQLVGQFLWMTMTAIRYIGIQIPLTSLYVLVLLAGCILLIPSFGLHGAGYALLLGSLTMLVGNGMVNLLDILGSGRPWTPYRSGSK